MFGRTDRYVHHRLRSLTGRGVTTSILHEVAPTILGIFSLCADFELVPRPWSENLSIKRFIV